MPERDQTVLVMGASGRLGRMLRQIWQNPDRFTPVWQYRNVPPAGGLLWNPVSEPYPEHAPRPSVVLCLAGVTGMQADLSANTDLALAALRCGARHVFLMSSAAVYGAGGNAAMGEDHALRPLNAYGHAKVAMEDAIGAAGASAGTTILRLGNVAGADALLGRAVAGETVLLDRVEGQSGGPHRSYIGPRGLARLLHSLITQALDGRHLPPVLNVAAPGALAMAELLDAAGVDWRFRAPAPGLVPRVELDVTRLQQLYDFRDDEVSAVGMVREWRSLGGDCQ